MRHRKARRKFSRTTAQRRSMMRNLTSALLEHERIVTTELKAKEVRRYAEKMITLAKRGEDLHARRQAYSFIPQQKVVQKLFESIGPRFLERNGGYTRIYKLGHRHGDAAPMAVIELVTRAAEKSADEDDSKKTKKKGFAQKLGELRKKRS